MLTTGREGEHRLADGEPEADLADSAVHLLELRPHLRALAGSPVDRLLEIATSSERSVRERHAAGLHLGLIGDPRVESQVPDMVDIPGARTAIGLAADRVDSVTASWEAVGVMRTWIAKEVPRHPVTLGPFRLARYPVTNIEYLRYVQAQPDAVRPTAWAHGAFPLHAANQPAYSLPPEAAEGYVAWLSASTGRRFRLPTEAEWEYAASGGDGREFPWGDEWDPTKANTAEAGPLTSTPVGIYVEGASPFGVCDMAGNVEEYVADDYRPYPGADEIRDDLVDLHGTYRILRGGCFARHGDLARCSRRHGWYPSDHYAAGFRVAEDVAAGATTATPS